MSTGVALRLRGLRKSFGSNTVLRTIDLDIPAGRVTALMGANGAGKSTLVKIVGGVHKADAGSMDLRGPPLRPGRPGRGDPRRRRDGAPDHQTTAWSPTWTWRPIWSSTAWPAARVGCCFNPARARREAAEIAARMGLDLDLRAPVQPAAAGRTPAWSRSPAPWRTNPTC